MAKGSGSFGGVDGLRVGIGGELGGGGESDSSTRSSLFFFAAGTLRSGWSEPKSSWSD